MWSLILLDIITFYILFITQIVDEQTDKVFCIVLILITTFISGFQYGVGADYWSYVGLYYNSYIDSIMPYPEITFRFFSEVLRGEGFSAQIIFLVYSLIINSFLFLAFKAYFFTYRNIILAYTFYVFCVFPGFYESLVTIRAMAASSILLYASVFLYNKKIKYILLTILAGLFHTVAFVAMILVFLPRIKYKKYLVIPILLGALLNTIGLVDIFFSLDLGAYSNHVNAYEEVMGDGNFSFRIIYDFILIVILFFITEFRFDNYYMHIPLEFLSYGIGIHIAFFNMGALITRIYQPFYIFIILALTNVVLNKKCLSNNLMIISLLFMIVHIFFIDNLNTINPFEFNFNFDLLE